MAISSLFKNPPFDTVLLASIRAERKRRASNARFCVGVETTTRGALVGSGDKARAVPHGAFGLRLMTAIKRMSRGIHVIKNKKHAGACF